MASRVMCKALSPLIVQDTLGNALFAAKVRIYQAGTLNPVTVYRAATGSQTFPQPLKTDHEGQTPGYLAPMQMVDVSINGGPVITMPVVAGDIGLGDLTDGAYWEALINAGGGGSSGLVATPVKTAAYSAAVGDLVLADSSGGSFPVTLPNAPAPNSRIGVVLTAGTALTINRSGSDTIAETSSGVSMSMSATGEVIEFEYIIASGQWRVVMHSLPPGESARKKLWIPSVPVMGAFDAVNVTDASISSGALNKVTSAALGQWAVGKTAIIRGAKTANATLVSTISSVSGTTATLATPANLAVSGGTAWFGTDDTAAWLQALSDAGSGATIEAGRGGSVIASYLRLAEFVDLVGQGKGVTTLVLAAAGAGLGYGPAFTHAGAGPLNYGKNGRYSIDGNWLSTQPLLINAVNANFEDIAVLYGNGDNILCGGQNCVLIKLNSAAPINGSNLVLDNGCGDYSFIQPELNFTGKWHIEIRSSTTAENIGYGIPEYNYFEQGICEARNVFAIGTPSPGLGNVLITAGRFNVFADFNFYMDSWIAGNRDAMVWIRGAATGVLNPDASYNINGDHIFRDCTWTGPGSGYAIETDNVDGGGVAQPFSAVLVPYELQGYNVASNLDYFDRIGTGTPPRHRGELVLV